MSEAFFSSTRSSEAKIVFVNRKTGQVSPRLAKIICWAPRLATILIIFFVSLFSLDVFEMGRTPLELLGGFLMHNIPSFALILLLILACKRPFVGFVAFLAAAVALGLFFLGPIFSRCGSNQGAVFSPGMLIFVLPILLLAAQPLELPVGFSGSNLPDHQLNLTGDRQSPRSIIPVSGRPLQPDSLT